MASGATSRQVSTMTVGAQSGVQFKEAVAAGADDASHRSADEASHPASQGQPSLDRVPLERDPEDAKQLKPIPTIVVPIYSQRLVLVKIGDQFLRIGTGSKPVVSKLKPPLHQPVDDEVSGFLKEQRARQEKCRTGIRRRGQHKPRKTWLDFNFPDFTFVVDESASLIESWYRNARAFFNIRLGVKRNDSAGGGGGKADTEETEYLCAMRTPNGTYEVQFDKQTFGSWWRITALSFHGYVAESVQFPGRCLTKDCFGLCLTPPLSERERASIFRGHWDKARTLTIYTLPDFAVWHPGAYVN